MAWQDRDYHQGTSDHDFFSRVKGNSVNFWLIMICIAVFFIDGFSARMMGRPYWAGGILTQWGNFNATDAIRYGQVWRFLTFQFLHAGLLHIIFNLVILFFLGRFVESYLGSKRYLAFYLICGAGGALLYLLLLGAGMLAGHPNIPFFLNDGAGTPLVGASAGIFGVLVGVATVAPDKRIHLLFPPIAIPIRVLAWVLIGIAFFMVMVDGENSGGEAAHLGGALFGFILMKKAHWLDWADRLSPSAIQRGVNDGRFKRKKEKEAATEAEVDRILDKVRTQGLQSLTRREKKTLNEATKRQKQAS